MTRILLPVLCICFALLSSCASSTKSSNEGGSSRCCLVEPGKGAVMMPDRVGAGQALEQWVNTHAHKLSISGGAKPRFVLLHVSKDSTIKDQMPVTDQTGPGKPHRLTDQEVAKLRACFGGGRKAKVDWATKRVTEVEN